MRQQTRKIPLKNVNVSGGPQPVSIKSATLVLYQDYIADDLGGHMAGLKSWDIHVFSGLPFELLASGSPLTFQSGDLSGSCFAVNNSTLKGTGPVAGIP